MRDKERLAEGLEFGGLGALWLALAFAPLATGAVRASDLAVVSLLLATGLLLWCARFWVNRGSRLLLPPAAWVALCGLAFAAIQCHRAELVYAARAELQRLAVYGVIFVLTLHLASRQNASQWTTTGLVYLGMAVACYGIFQFATGSDKVWGFTRPALYAGRASGSYICPNHFAGFLEMLIPIGAALALFGRLTIVSRLLLGYATLTMLAGLALSLSRAGWIAGAAGIGWVLLAGLRRRQARIAAAVALVALSLVAWWSWNQTFAARKRVQELFIDAGPQQTLRQRLVLWVAAYEMWRDHPWTGVGPGGFDHRFPAYRRPDIQSRPAYAHNDYLNVLTDWGLAGAGFAAAFLAVLGYGVVRVLRYVGRRGGDFGESSSTRYAVGIGCSGGLVALLVHSFVDFNLQIPANAGLAAALAGLLAGQIRFTTDRYWIRVPLAGRLALAALTLCASGWMGTRAVISLQESRALAQAEVDPTRFVERLEALKLASRIEPSNPQTAYAIGETLRVESWRGADGYAALATEALGWFALATRLNPYDPYARMRYGMCLDWLGRHTEAGPYYDQALALDPHNYYLVAHKGWHLVQVGREREALGWFERSFQLNFLNNPIAVAYRKILRERLNATPADSPPSR